VEYEGRQDSSFPAMNNSIQQIAGVIKNDPAVANVISFTGGNGATNAGSLYVALKRWRRAMSVPLRSSTACALN